MNEIIQKLMVLLFKRLLYPFNQDVRTQGKGVVVDSELL